MVRAAAGDEDDAPQVTKLVLGHAEAVQHEPTVAHAVADRLRHALRLLVDLLQHERLVARPLGGRVVPVDLDHVMLDRLAGDRVDDPHLVRRDRHDLTVVGELHATRFRQEGCEVGGEEVLVLAEPDHHRRLVAHADEVVRVVPVDDDEREVALEPAVDGTHRRREIALVDRFEQVRHDLGVGLRGERMP